MTIGALITHHGQEKLAERQQFANTVVASLHLPSPLFIACAAGFNIHVLELVLLYLGGSLALLFNGPGRFSFDAGIVPELVDDLSAPAAPEGGVSTVEAIKLRSILIGVDIGTQG